MSSSSQREDQPPSTDGDAQSSQGDDQPPSTDDDAQSSQGDDQSPSADGAQSSSSSQGDDLFPPILDDADDAVIADTWQVYKHATPIKSGTGEEVFDFVTKYICPSMGAPSEIGCGGLKVGCTVYSATGYDAMELHWVDSVTLDQHSGGTTVSDWQEYFHTLNGQHGDLSTFNAFMHNKNQLFIDDLGAVQSPLDADGVAYMRRRSYDATGAAIAHLAIEVAGRLVEFVGPLSTLDDATGFDEWTTDECPAAHALKWPLSQYRHWARDANRDNDGSSVTDDQVTGWKNAKNRTVPLFVASHAASHDPVTHGTLVASLMNFTNASASTLQDDDDCTVMSIALPNFDGFEFKYAFAKKVDAAAVADGAAHSVADYDEYVENVHQEYLRQRANGSWFEWDHFLDQHIGLQYYEVGDACVDKDRAVREALHEQRIPVGERRDMEGLSTGATNWTTHYYTGYKGTVTWEFNLQCSTDDGAPNVCACMASNNNIEYWTQHPDAPYLACL